jgi:hypothetical protein
MDVMLPGGTKIRATSIAGRGRSDPKPSFGLYMDRAWQPTWSAEMIEWPDFGLPADPERAAQRIEAAYARAKAGETVEIGCLGGLGRTGTVLACMAVLAGVPSTEAVGWVRSAYHVEAVETDAQAAWVRWFAERTGPVSP